VLRGRPESLAASLVELRAGRALMAFVTGGALALAGVMMQALLRNPLADPYVLGISAGATEIDPLMPATSRLATATPSSVTMIGMARWRTGGGTGCMARRNMG
jgi:iron complex transport system permease protein